MATQAKDDSALDSMLSNGPPLAQQRTRRADGSFSAVDDSAMYGDAKTYYTSEQDLRNHGRARTYSQNGLAQHFERLGLYEPHRRGSHGKFPPP